MISTRGLGSRTRVIKVPLGTLGGRSEIGIGIARPRPAAGISDAVGSARGVSVIGAGSTFHKFSDAKWGKST
jgi:hypothetical protein